ncbi:fimbrillin family protein [Hoylesella enoeca]|nr:fimbrillin family protein [Hoylesella enoeca]
MNMKTNITSIFAAALVLFTASCANEETTKQDTNQEIAAGTNFVGGSAIKTRTSLDVTLPGGTTVDYFWEPSDKIWTADGATGTAQITAKSATANFRMSKAYNTSTVDVYYPGVNATAYNQVTIATAQTQTAPNSTKHLGEAGDCGVATAHQQADNSYHFDLDHKAAYLCLLPRTPNKLVSTYITQVKITSDNNIAGTYTLSSTGLTGSGSSNEITVTTLGNGFVPGPFNYDGTQTTVPAPGFPLNNAATSQSTNAIYAVIAPGTHTLTIEYTIKDIVTNVGGTITKMISSTHYAENTVYPITANIKVTEYPGDNYYMWDAQQQYWAGHEWNKSGYVAGVDQPTNRTQNTSTDPRNNTDPRWRREDASWPYPAANRSCKDCPNVNECIWYCMQGDPHYDDQTRWATMGHLYKGGIWLKKKTQISGFTESNYNGTDYRNTDGYFDNISVTPNLPINLSDYFYLPMLGNYQSSLCLLNYGGFFWSCTPHPIYTYHSDYAYYMEFSQSNVTVRKDARTKGFLIWKADDSDNQYRPLGM